MNEISSFECSTVKGDGGDGDGLCQRCVHECGEARP